MGRSPTAGCGGAKPLAFALIGLVMWYFMLKSGVHATIAGVLMALAVPLRHQLSPQQLQQELRPLMGQGGGFEQVEIVIQHLEDVLAKAHSPLHEIEHSLAPYVAFVIMPVFAFFNAGVALVGGQAGAARRGLDRRRSSVFCSASRSASRAAPGSPSRPG